MSGNGYATGSAVNFGIGILSGNSNLVEANTCIGNTHGIVVFAAATNSKIQGNVAVGNPSIQQSNSLPGSAGVDIWDQSPRGATVFDKNICVTAINAPCPGVPTGVTPRKPTP